MADISKITLPNSDTYNLKDSSAARIEHKHHFRDFEPLQYKEYTGVYSEQDNDTYGYKFYGSIKPTSYKALWYVRLHIVAYVPNSADYYGDYIFEMNGMRSTYSTYSCYNAIQNTDYKPLYYTTLRFASNEANANSYGHLIGTYLRSCANYTNASYARTIRIEVLETENCEFEFFDSYKIYSQVPGTGSFNGNSNFNHYSAGLQETGDSDTTPNGNNYYRATTDSVGIQQNSFVMEGPNNTIGSIATTSSTSTTNKVCNPNGFLVGGEIMWYNSGNVAANTALSQAWRGFYSLWASYLDFRYSSNCGTTLTPNSSLYLVGTIRDNLFYLDTPWWTTTPPTTDDGKIYILIGNTYSNYQINLFQKKLWMHFKDGVFKEYVPAHKHTASDVTGLATVATTGSYNNLSDKPTIPTAVTESTVSGWGFTKNTGTYSKPSTGIPKTDLASAVQTSLGKADSALQSYTETDPVFSASAAAGIKSSDITAWNGKQNAITSTNKLDYSLLSGTPTIPSAVTESTVSGWGFTKNTGTYSKPSGGIPKTDLASAVQTSLGKADSALQSYTETDPVFSASPAAGITAANITSWNNKGTYSKPSGGIPASDLADTYLKSYTETDPVFSASAAAGITSTNISTWNSKGTYSKPSGGIPKTDLASAVQTSLGKADSALQSFTETDPVFSASAAAGITSSNIAAWNGKQDAITSSNKLSYSLLSGTPTIPSAVTESTVSGWGFKKISAGTSAPSTLADGEVYLVYEE